MEDLQDVNVGVLDGQTRRGHDLAPGPRNEAEGSLTILGIILIIIGTVVDISILTTIGIVLAALGVLLWLLG